MSPRHDKPVALMHSQQLWLPGQKLGRSIQSVLQYEQIKTLRAGELLTVGSYYQLLGRQSQFPSGVLFLVQGCPCASQWLALDHVYMRNSNGTEESHAKIKM